MGKEFERTSEGGLTVTVRQEDKLFLPLDKEKVELGTYEQVTVQHVFPDKVKVLVRYVAETLERLQNQVADIDKELNVESLKGLDVNAIPEKYFSDITKAVLENKNKKKQATLADLNLFLMDVNKKRRLVAQKEFVSKQLAEVLVDARELERLADGFKNYD